MSRGLKEKMVVAFCLMSVVPLLVLIYIITNYTLPSMRNWWDLWLILGIVAAIAILGFIVTRSFVLPVVKLAEEAKTIAAGHIEQQIAVQTEDEVGTLGKSLNEITHRVRENMTQLRAYGEETRHLHLEINRRIVTLSNLLQVSNLITQSAKVEEVVAFILEKLAQTEEAELNLFLEQSSSPELFVVRMAMGSNRTLAEQANGKSFSLPWLQRAISEGKVIVIDSSTPSDTDRQSLRQQFDMSNGVCQPLVIMGKVVGVLLCMNPKPDFIFDDDMLDILKVFAKQMSIAIENDLLVKRAKKLEILDEVTGLYNGRYAKNRLEEEIHRAMRFHRPCSLVVLSVDGFRQLEQRHGKPAANNLLSQMAEVIRGELSEVDRAGRIGQDEFCLILPERNKREAIQIAEKIRKRIETHPFMKDSQKLGEAITISGGISENPLDGSTSEELFSKAAEFIKQAKAQGENKIFPTLQGH